MFDQAQQLRELTKKLDNKKPKVLKMPKTKVLAITSGKGGVGKTNLAINLALALRDLGKEILIFDADFGLANADLILGVKPKFTLAHVIRGEKRLDEIVLASKGIKLIAGGSGVEELAELQSWQLDRFLTGIQALENKVDYVIVDTGAGIAREVLWFVLSAHDIIMVTTPEPTAITDAYVLIKIIASKNKEALIRLVVNRATNTLEANQVIERISTATKKYLSFELQNLGYIVEDPQVMAAVKKQEPFILIYPRSLASKCVKQLARSLENIDDNFMGQRDGLKGIFQRMFQFIR
jgi:flagellar biosynthesis protein FlhG